MRPARTEFVNRQSSQSFLSAFGENDENICSPERQTLSPPYWESLCIGELKMKRGTVNRLQNGGLFQGTRKFPPTTRVVSFVEVFPLPYILIITD